MVSNIEPGPWHKIYRADDNMALQIIECGAYFSIKSESFLEIDLDSSAALNREKSQLMNDLSNLYAMIAGRGRSNASLKDNKTDKIKAKVKKLTNKRFKKKYKNLKRESGPGFSNFAKIEKRFEASCNEVIQQQQMHLKYIKKALSERWKDIGSYD